MWFPKSINQSQRNFNYLIFELLLVSFESRLQSGSSPADPRELRGQQLRIKPPHLSIHQHRLNFAWMKFKNGSNQDLRYNFNMRYSLITRVNCNKAHPLKTTLLNVFSLKNCANSAAKQNGSCKRSLP